MAFQSKNSRVGKLKEQSDGQCLPRYNPANVGATWKTKCKGKSKPLDFRIKEKRGGYRG